MLDVLWGPGEEALWGPEVLVGEPAEDGGKDDMKEGDVSDET